MLLEITKFIKDKLVELPFGEVGYEVVGNPTLDDLKEMRKLINIDMERLKNRAKGG